VMMVLLPALILGADVTLDCGPDEVTCPGVADCVPKDECPNDGDRDGHNTCRWLPWVDRDDPSFTADAEFYKNKSSCLGHFVCCSSQQADLGCRDPGNILF